MRKLIDFYPDLLNEAGAGDEAKRRGLKSIGFGRYADPSTGKVVAKSQDGKLVAVKGADDVEPTKKKPSEKEAPKKKKLGGKKSKVGGKKEAPPKKTAPKPSSGGGASHPYLPAIEKMLARLKGDDTQLTPAAQKQRNKMISSLEKQKAKLSRGKATPDRDVTPADLGNAAGRADARQAKLQGKSITKPLGKVPAAMVSFQGENLRKVFGRNMKLNKSLDVSGQKQVWWDLHGAGAHKAQMVGKFDQWQRNALNKIKKVIASNPELEGWKPVFKQDPVVGSINVVMVKEG